MKHIIFLSLLNPERGSEGDSAGVFEIRWAQTLIFDTSMARVGTDFKIVDYSWDDSMKEETKQSLRLLWAPFVEWQGTPQSTTKKFTYLSANDLLKCVTATLDR